MYLDQKRDIEIGSVLMMRSVFVQFKQFARKIFKKDLIQRVRDEKNLQNDENSRFSYKHSWNRILDIEHLDIAFIVPNPIKGSGGHRNLYRAVYHLHNFGHRLTVYYCQTANKADVVKAQVSKWFYNMDDIPFIRYDGTLAEHDIAFATWWESAYYLQKNRMNIRFPFYFVQDFEAYFFPMSSGYILAENTYRMGFTCVCSGPWISTLLKRRYNAEAEYFQFPVDRTIYYNRQLRTKENLNIIFFAKPEMPRRCYEIGIRALEIFHEQRPDVEIILFGSSHIHPENVPFPATIKKLLPNIYALAEMYRNADLGIVFSTTNPSLVPYEMMACGCPVVDLDLEFAENKYGGNRENIFLLSPQPEIMGKQLAILIDNKSKLRDAAVKGRVWVEQNFPTEREMAERIQDLIKIKINNTSDLVMRGNEN